MSHSVSSASEFDLEDLLHVEQRLHPPFTAFPCSKGFSSFFDAGYTDGHAHGRIHGLIEGRAIGREEGYQLWEEIAFYEGFAKLWEGVCKTPDLMGHTNKRFAPRAPVSLHPMLTILK
jgi:Essential protein Yae1, N terminal